MAAGFDTFLRLVDENNPGCGTLDTDLTAVGQTFFTDNEFFRKNEEMKFYQGEGTQFVFNRGGLSLRPANPNLCI